ncbi:MAG: hypothetical protein A2W99_16430 [Bacteroidetes bacterium GWF2_33_16]|nr:MAG: hypothetical protein A2X00_14365 [Bacteroidetes bacterium GWE2_32_14]OFY03338.1 MAG: hypothetical protein A2W99_16430 [Bacteroidetes bacterium GWF2_33_16]
MNYFQYICFNLLLITVLSNCAKDTETTDDDPVIIEEGNFTFVLHDGLTQSIITPINTKLNDNYSRVLNDLEVSSMNMVSVKIWNNETNFLEDMEQAIDQRYQGASGWVYSSTDIRILYQGSYTSQIALHEFCHAVSLVVNNTIGNNPRWLWEAIAIYEAGEFVNPTTISYLVSGNFPTLAELNSDFNSGGNKIYSVGYLLSEFIIVSWDKSHFVNLIKANGNIEQTLGISTQQFEADWKSFVIKTYF